MFTKTDIEKYFAAEKSESLLFIILGITAIVIAIIFFFLMKTNWYKGFAIPFVVVGMLQLVVGYTIYTRSNSDRMRNVYAYDMNPSELKHKEIPRMEKVNKNFVLYRYIEIALLIIGLALFFCFKNDETKIFWTGFCVGLFIQAGVCLGADFFAEQRANVYIKGLKEFTKAL